MYSRQQSCFSAKWPSSLSKCYISSIHSLMVAAWLFFLAAFSHMNHFPLGRWFSFHFYSIRAFSSDTRTGLMVEGMGCPTLKLSLAYKTSEYLGRLVGTYLCAISVLNVFCDKLRIYNISQFHPKYVITFKVEKLCTNVKTNTSSSVQIKLVSLS